MVAPFNITIYMLNIANYLTQHFQSSLNDYIDYLNIGDINVDDFKMEISLISNKFKFTHVSNKTYHYQTNLMFLIVKLFNKYLETTLTPLQLNQSFVAWYDKKHRSDYIDNIKVYQKGAINITFKLSFIISQGQQLLLEPYTQTCKTNKKETIVVDFSSPNIAKKMHIGHLRSTVIGDVISRFFEFQGHDVKRINHLGDWGRPFGIVISYIIKYPDLMSDTLDDVQLQTIYNEGSLLFKSDPEFRQSVYQTTAKLQQKEPEIYKMWQTICNISRSAYQKIYDAFNIKLEDMGESYYQEQMVEMMDDLKKRNQLTILDDMEVVTIDEYDNPFILRKSDKTGGNFTYDTTDLSALKYRLTTLKADRIYYVVDSGQSNHFELLFKVAKKVGYLDNQIVKHINFGLIQLADGKKISSRKQSANTLKTTQNTGLLDIMNDGFELALEKTQSTNQSRNSDVKLTSNEIIEVARCLNHNCLKYFDLLHHRISNYKLNFDLLFSHKGNTAIYINYAYARLTKIITTFKTYYPDVDLDKLYQLSIQEEDYLKHVTPYETKLYLLILQFPEVMEHMEDTLLPSLLTTYLYQLVSQISTFYTNPECYCLVNDGDAKKVVFYNRIMLLELCLQVMDLLFEILGFQIIAKI